MMLGMRCVGAGVAEVVVQVLVDPFIASHFHHDHDYAYRGLRVKDLLAPMNIGNHTYASKHEFIRSGHRCGSRKASGEKLSEMREKLSQWMTDSKHRMDQTTNVVVSTYFHIITSGRTGAISNAISPVNYQY